MGCSRLRKTKKIGSTGSGSKNFIGNIAFDVILSPIGVLLEPIGVLLGSYWDPIGILLGSHWGPIGVLFGSYWGPIAGAILGLLYQDPIARSLVERLSGSYIGILFGSFWGPFPYRSRVAACLENLKVH